MALFTSQSNDHIGIMAKLCNRSNDSNGIEQCRALVNTRGLHHVDASTAALLTSGNDPKVSEKLKIYKIWPYVLCVFF